MKKWMEIACKEAIEGMKNNEGGPFGAVIIKENKIISQAHNEVLKSNDPTAHAEINAIRKASKVLESFDLSGCILYTSCKPCPMCLGAILWARIDKVYYGADEEDAARGGFDDAVFYKRINASQKDQGLEQIEHKECALLFDVWLHKSDRRGY